MVLQSGGSQKQGKLLQTPTEHRTKTDEPWQVRGYSWRFPNATWKVGGVSNTRKERT